jgi:hypothetical protein
MFSRWGCVPAKQEVDASVLVQGGPLEISEEDVLTDQGTTGAPHLSGLHGKGQRYKVFKGGPMRLNDLFQNALGSHAEKDFLVYSDPATKHVQRFTYQQTIDTARSLGGYLVDELAVLPGERVAVAMRNYPEWCFAFMAATAVGAVAVPTNSLWNKVPPDSSENSLAHSLALTIHPHTSTRTPKNTNMNTLTTQLTDWGHVSLTPSVYSIAGT